MISALDLENKIVVIAILTGTRIIKTDDDPRRQILGREG